jgi:hypothetical protein
MGKKGKDKFRDRPKDETKCKAECCKKYLKKGKHCKGCPMIGECRLPG